MKRTVRLSAGAVILLLWWLCITGYDIEMRADASLYTHYENVPFPDMKVSGRVQAGERAGVLGCFDNKTDFFFFVATEDGMPAYLYELKFISIKTWVPTRKKIMFFFHDPLASLQCLVMVPELASR